MSLLRLILLTLFTPREGFPALRNNSGAVHSAWLTLVPTIIIFIIQSAQAGAANAPHLTTLGFSLISQLGSMIVFGALLNVIADAMAKGTMSDALPRALPIAMLPQSVGVAFLVAYEQIPVVRTLNMVMLLWTIYLLTVMVAEYKSFSTLRAFASVVATYVTVVVSFTLISYVWRRYF